MSLDGLDGFESEDFLGDAVEKDNTLALLDEEGLPTVIKSFWNDIAASCSSYPLIKIYMASLYKMACEYDRIEDNIQSLENDLLEATGQAQLTNERSRIRDNIASLTTEGWKLLGAVLDSLHKVQSLLDKMARHDKDDADPFESFLSGGG